MHARITTGRLTLAAAAALSPLLAAAVADADNLIPNADLRQGKQGWSLFVPAESKAAGCRVEVTKDGPAGAAALRLSSVDFARYTVGQSKPVPCKPGDRFRVRLSVRGDAAAVKDGTPGVLVRLLLLQDGKTAPGNRGVYVGLTGKWAVTAGSGLSELAAPVPSAWTPIEAVVEVPASATDVNQISPPAVCGWYTRGSVLVSGLSLEKVASDTPLGTQTKTEQAAKPSGTKLVNDVTTDAAALAALDLDAPGMAEVKAAAQRNDLAAVKQAYLQYRRTGCKAKWFASAVDKPARAIATADAQGDEIARGLIRNSYGFRPSTGDMGQPIDWKANPLPKGDPDYTHEWTYCVMSRTGFWKRLADAYWNTQDEKYARTWVAQLNDFVAKNPCNEPGGEPSLWRTLDASARMNDSWPNVYARFVTSPSFTPDAQWTYLRSILDHAAVLKAGLAVPGRTGNWVMSESYALFVIGTLFPELRDAAALRDLAVARMLKEIEYCVPPDGFEAELTPNYHYFTLSSFTGPMRLAKLNGIELSDAFRDKVRAMYRAPVMVSDQAGNAVGTNDSHPFGTAKPSETGLKLLGSDPLLEWSASGGARGTPPPTSTVLPYAGFYAMRGGWKKDDTFLFFRAGPTGIEHNHQAMNDVVLRAWDKTLIFEQGTSAYNRSQTRDYVLGTSSHNSVIVDGKGQSQPRTIAPVTTPVNNPWVTTPLFDFVSGTYADGYRASTFDVGPNAPPDATALDKSVTHTRRVVFLKPYYALVLDTLDGTGQHTFDALFHLNSNGASVDAAANGVFSTNNDDVQVGLYAMDRTGLKTDVVSGQAQPMLGWKGETHQPMPVVRFRKQQATPATFATFLYPYRGDRPAFTAAPLPVGNGLWGQTLHTDEENVAIALSPDNTPRPIQWQQDGMRAMAAGLIARTPKDGVRTTGGWKLTTYADATCRFTTDAPADLGWLASPSGMTVFNAGAEPVNLKLAAPFEAAVVLPPQTWSRVETSGRTDVDAPNLFKPPAAPPAGPTFAEYARGHTAKTTAAAAPVRVSAKDMQLPIDLSIKSKIGADKAVNAIYDENGNELTARFDLPQAGWYRINARYCTADAAVRTLIVNGKCPYREARNFSLPSTVGKAPSDGWSNNTDDWHVAALGKTSRSGELRVFLEPGANTVTLKRESGGLSIDWMELEPVR